MIAASRWLRIRRDSNRNRVRQATRKRQRALLIETLERREVFAAFTAGNLAMLVAGANANNTVGSIVEINTTTPGQNPVQTILLPDTSSVDSYRMSGSATSTGYVSRSNDGSLLSFTGHNSTTTVSNANTLTTRGVYTLNNAGTVVKQTTYTGTSGQQTRGATSIDNQNWFIGDQGGFYTNAATTASPVGNVRSVRAFGGTVYAFTASASNPPVGTISAPTGGTYTSLPGLANGAASRQDFYLIQSGNNGASYDVLYVLDATSSTVGAVSKFSLVSGSWTSNGSYTTNFGGFSLAAEDRDLTNTTTGAFLYVSSGTGATTANTVRKLTDTAGYNSTISITTADNVTLYTAASNTIIKGLDFTPASTTSPSVASSGATNVTDTGARLNGNVTSDGGASITERGFVYSLTSANNNPRIGGSGTTKVIVSGTTGSFTNDLSGLASSTNYSFVAYAINSVGTSYSTTQSFTTLGTPVLPTIGNPTVSGITLNSATLGGNVISDGNSTITARGVVYSLTSVNPNPTLIGKGTTTLTDSQTTTGVYTVSATGLSSGSDYSFVAYVTNGIGTTYTTPVSTFKTLALPTLSGLAAPNVFDTFATASANVVNDGGAPITARGFVLSQTSVNNSPQLSGIGVTNYSSGNGTGAFSRSLGQLLPNTQYSLAGYATSVAGTSYTTVSTFTTTPASATSLAAGDLAFTGYNGTTTTERISFVLLKNVSAGTSILFTDNGWDGNLATPAFATNEAHYQLGFTQAFNAGARFYYDSGLTSFVNFDGTTTGLISSVSGNTGFSNSGDQLTAVQGTLASPSSFIAQISSGAFISTGSIGTQTTYLAPGLAIGTSAISLNAATSNGVLNSADPDVGSSISNSVSGIRGIVNDVSNWTVNTSTSLVVPPDVAFIVLQSQTITFNPLGAKTYGDASFELTATASSGLTVTYVSSDPTIASVSGSTVTILKAGETTITASQSGNSTYAAATPVQRTLTVNKKALTVTADAKSKLVGQTDPVLTYSQSGLVSGDLISGSLTRESGETVGTYSILQGTLDAGANYSITYVGAILTINAPAPTLTSVVVNGADSFSNNNQRSMVTSVVVTFSAPVTLAAGAFTIRNIGLFTASDTTLAQSQLLITPNGTSDTYTIRFGDGSGVNSRSGTGNRANSLADGNYRLEIDRTKVTNAGGNLAGNTVFGAAATDNFFRMYGDSNGDGRVDGTDLAAIRGIILYSQPYNAAFDWDGDGSVSVGVDTINFSQRQNRRRRSF